MKIEFTTEQFGDFLKIIYLGNWLANAIHNDSKSDPRDKKFDAIENHIFSLANDCGWGDYIEYDEEQKRYFPNNKFDELVHKYIDDYDENCFWEELFYKMSSRDFVRAFSSKGVLKMAIRERFEKEEPFREKWDKEINEYGIERLEINNGNKNDGQ